MTGRDRIRSADIEWIKDVSQKYCGDDSLLRTRYMNDDTESKHWKAM